MALIINNIGGYTTAFKTINGQTITGDGNINTSCQDTMDYVVSDGVQLNLTASMFGGTPIVSQTESGESGYHVVFAGTVNEISVGAFSGMTTLQSITIPSLTLLIRYNAFDGCTSLSSITIPDACTYIGQNAFRGTAIANFNFNKVKDFGDGVLANSSSTGVTFASGTTQIKDYTCNNCTSLQSVNIPSGVTYIGYYAFRNNQALSSVTIPEGVQTISGDTFGLCYSLSSITLPSTLTVIGDGAFYTSGIQSIDIPSGVGYVGAKTFKGCTSLKSVSMHSNMYVWKEAFSGCTGLTHITNTGSIIYKGVDSLKGCNDLRVIRCAATVYQGISTSSALYGNNCPIFVKNEGYEASRTGIATQAKDRIMKDEQDYNQIIYQTYQNQLQMNDIVCTGAMATNLITGTTGSIGVITTDGEVNEIISFGTSNNNLGYIILPNCVYTIGVGAFNGCYARTLYFQGDCPNGIAESGIDTMESLTMIFVRKSAYNSWVNALPTMADKIVGIFGDWN